MATSFPAVPPGDVWGQDLIDAIESRDDDAIDAAAAYTDSLYAFGAPSIVLGPQDPVPANTPAGTLIFRTA